ncbi:MAG: nucleoside hydrolase [Chloroflexi bacterium]|nr:nucleoside hydrolase [Chloroflexota bacterium]MDA1148006.1 nucleoside hydrolase [Chloroflexota bacterium]
MTIPFLMDTDIAADVDDALALAFALRQPDLELRGVTTAAGDTRRRARVARKLLHLAGRDDIEVAAGEWGVQTNARQVNENGLEDSYLGDVSGYPSLEPSERDGVSLLLEECAAHGYPIAVIGPPCNIAAAVLREPAFAKQTAGITVMGGIFAPIEYLGRTLPPTIDHNLNVDQAASIVALNAGIATTYVPGDVTMGTWVTTRHLEALRSGDSLCQELARQIEVWTPRMHRLAEGRCPPEYVAMLHDPLTLACMTEEGRAFVTSHRAPVTVAVHEDHVRTFIDPAAGAEAEIIDHVEVEAFADYCIETILG